MPFEDAPTRENVVIGTADANGAATMAMALSA